MREEENARAVAIQQELAELKRRQEEKEREKAAVEERSRRRTELQTGRQEMLQNLTRGVGLLEESEFNARRDAEQMAKVLADFRDALTQGRSHSRRSLDQRKFRCRTDSSADGG